MSLNSSDDLIRPNVFLAAANTETYNSNQLLAIPNLRILALR